MTKKYSGLTARGISKFLEKMIHKKTGKRISIKLKNVTIETHGNNVDIIIEGKGTVDRKDFDAVAPFLDIK